MLSKKFKVVPNCPKWRENWLEIIFGFVTKKIMGGRKNVVKQNYQNGWKIC